MMNSASPGATGVKKERRREGERERENESEKAQLHMYCMLMYVNHYKQGIILKDSIK